MPHEISILKTGRGLAGSRVALIFAPPDAQAGSLITLTEFLNAQPDIRAVPGYHGPNKNHVLRVSGLPNDERFLKLLTRDFPAWQVEHYPDEASPITIAPDACCEPLDEVDHFPHQTAFRRAVKENANIGSGIAYMAGSMALLLAAWRAPKRMPGLPMHDWFRSYTALSYFTASAILVALSQKNDNPRDVYSIMESVYPPLAMADGEARQQMQEEAGKVMTFLRQHPWEISMLLNASGAATHAISSGKRGRTTEMAAALATLVACTTSAIIPEKGGRSMVPLGEWLEDTQGRGVMERLEAFGESHPFHRGWISKASEAADWIQENPLKVASFVSGAANIGYAASGVTQKNHALTVMAVAFGAGNYAQSQATKGRGDGFDSVVTAASNIISADDSLKDASPEQVRGRIQRLAEKLTGQREIVHTAERLKRGIKTRLKRYGIDKQQEGGDLTTGFLPNEAYIMRHSPFANPESWQRLMRLHEQRQTDQNSVVAAGL